MSVLPPLVSWLAGTLLPLGALWLLFRGALRAERCFGYNRALLLLAPVVAAALPLLPRPEWMGWLPSAAGASGTTAAVLLPTVQAAVAPANSGPWAGWPWLTALYLAGVAVGLARLAYQSWQVGRTARRLPREEHAGYVLAYTGGQLPTSSFGRTVFWDETAGLTPAEAASVLAHELAHVRQGHTFDVLWLEVWRAVLWVNPFIYLLLPALRLTHELLADEAAATAAPPAANATPYPTLLARLATQQLDGSRYISLIQHFTLSFTLTRIAMLQNKIPVRRWKQVLALPVLAGSFLATSQVASAQSVPLASDKAARKAASKKELVEAWRQDSLAGGQSKPGVLTIRRDAAGKIKITHETNPAIPAPPIATGRPATPSVIDGRKVYTYVDEMPALPGGGAVAAIVKAIQDKLVYPKLDKSAQMDGLVFAKFTVDAAGAVQDPAIIKGLSTPYDEAVLASVRQLPRFIPGKQNGQSVAVSFTVPVRFQQVEPK